MPRIARIINSRGEPEPYDHGKVVASILDAVRSAGHFDETLADKLAPMVEFGLSRRYGTTPTVEDIAHCIEQSLRTIIDFPEIAEHYVANRRKRERLRELAEKGGAGSATTSSTATAEPAAGATASESAAAARADKTASTDEPPPPIRQPRLSRGQVEAMLLREYGISPTAAHEAAASVARHADGLAAALGLPAVPSSLVRALADAELIARGLVDPSQGPSQYGVPAFDLQQATFPLTDASGAQPETPPIATARGLEEWASAAVLRQHALVRVHSRPVAAAIAGGRITVAHIEQPARFAALELFVPRILSAGAGLGLDSGFPGAVAGASEAVRRICDLAAAAWDTSAGDVRLAGFDSALAPWARNPAEADGLAAALAGRFALLTRGGARKLVLSFDAAAGQAHRPGSPALATAWLSLAADGTGAIVPELRVGAAAMGDPLSEALLARAAETASRGAAIRFAAVRAGTESVETTMFGETVTHAAAIRVTPAVVTLALGAGVSAPGSAAFDDELDASIALAAAAVKERRDFLARFHQRRPAGGARPGLEVRLGEAASRAGGACRVRLLGLSEAASAQAAAGAVGVASSASVLRAGQRLAGYIALKLGEAAKRAGVEVTLGGDDLSFQLGGADDGVLPRRMEREGTLHALAPDSVVRTSAPDAETLMAAIAAMVAPDGPPVGCISVTPGVPLTTAPPQVAPDDGLFRA